MTTPTTDATGKQDDRGQVRMTRATKTLLDNVQNIQAAALGVRTGQKGLTVEHLVTALTVLASKHEDELTDLLRPFVGK